MIAKILGLVAGNKIAIYAGLAAIALFVGMNLRIQLLKSDVEDLQAVLADTTSMLQVVRNSNNINAANAVDLAGKLEMCVVDNMVLRANGEKAVRDFEAALGVIKDNANERLRDVQEMLQHETCAVVTIPSDVERVLRNGAPTGTHGSP